MQNNRGLLRTFLLNARAWDSYGKSLNNKINSAIDRALQALAEDAPQTLMPSVAHVAMLPLVNSASSMVNATIRVVSPDRRVMEFRDPTNGNIDSGVTTWRPTIDGTWDGVMWLEITDRDGQVHRRRSMEWWRDTAGIGTIPYYVSLDRPWPNSVDHTMAFKIYQPCFTLPADVIRVYDPAELYDESRMSMTQITESEAWSGGYVKNRSNDSAGSPYVFWRGEYDAIPAPTEAPAVEVTKDAWAGPYQEGDWDFCYTVVWGVTDQEWAESRQLIRDPQYESAPSPAVSFSHDTGTNAGYEIQLQASNVDVLLGFELGAGGGLRQGRSGHRIRFYARRTKVRAAGLGTINNVETSDRWYLLAEVEPDTLSDNATYVWDGSHPEDGSRPLVESSGYYRYYVYPLPDRRYEMDFRVARRPGRLLDDQDTIPLQPGAIEALKERALYEVCLLDGADEAAAAKHFQLYQLHVETLRANYSSPAKKISPATYAYEARRARWRFTEG